MPTLPQKALVVLHDTLAREYAKRKQVVSFNQIIGVISQRYDKITAQPAADAKADAKKEGR
jgi:hypothetical protein